MGQTYNQLNYGEVIRLADAVRGVKKPFKKWDQAANHFTSVLGRKITKSNIEGSCKHLEIDVSMIVELAGRASRHPNANMAARMDSLEARLAELEKLLE